MNFDFNKKQKHLIIKDAYSFTDDSSSDNSKINCNSSTYHQNTKRKTDDKKRQNYAINLDWLQFVALRKTKVEFDNFKSQNFVINEQRNRNPNFKNCYVVMKESVELFELFANKTNNSYLSSEVLVKVKNNLLYVGDYMSIVNPILNELGLKFLRISRIDIAVDSVDIIRVMDLLRRFTRNKTIQVGNNNLKVDPGYLEKTDHTYDSYRIGNKRCNKSAIAYVKTKEIKNSQKDYIKEWWELNGIDSQQEVGRFEIQLKYLQLKKYHISSLEILLDTSFIGSLFRNEVEGWLEMYRVKLQDLKKHRKDIAIRKGKKLKLFHWQDIPTISIGIQLEDAKIDPIMNAKRSISFSVDQLVNQYNNDEFTVTGGTLNYINNVTVEYDLQDYTKGKFQKGFDKSEKLGETDRVFILREFKDNRDEKYFRSRKGGSI
ncbi:MAG: hypothetical protein ACERKD_12065 [Prolixibacteraceae bacterium]